MVKIAKRAKAFSVDADKAYGLAEAIVVVKSNATAKFDETVEVSVNLGVDPRHADQQVRGVVNLPSGTGRDVRVAVFAKDAKAAEALAAGADVVGAEDLVERIQGGFMDFDRVIATPDMMALVGRLGKVLGPRGLMPNPKVGTVTPNVGQAVKDAKGGAVEFRVEKSGIVHAGVGKVSFTDDALIINIKALVDALNRSKPTGAKGLYIKKISLSSTMGPGLRVDTASISAEDPSVPSGSERQAVPHGAACFRLGVSCRERQLAILDAYTATPYTRSWKLWLRRKSISRPLPLLG